MKRSSSKPLPCREERDSETALWIMFVNSPWSKAMPVGGVNTKVSAHREIRAKKDGTTAQVVPL